MGGQTQQGTGLLAGSNWQPERLMLSLLYMCSQRPSMHLRRNMGDVPDLLVLPHFDHGLFKCDLASSSWLAAKYSSPAKFKRAGMPDCY